LSFSNSEGYSYALYLKDLSGKTVKIIERITEEKNEITRDGLPIVVNSLKKCHKFIL
jgi:hypothetical protein